MVHLLELADRTDQLSALLSLWEASVRATHTFLCEADIVNLRPVVAEAIGMVPQFAVVSSDDTLLGFIGAAEGNVEMLFLHPDARGRGYGRQLMEHAITVWGCASVDVNEQNPQALGFYQHLGFQIAGRSALDGQGNPFPILHLKLNQNTEQ